MYEILMETQRQSGNRHNQPYLTVNLQLKRQIFRNNDDPNLPLFDQTSFKFDQDELAKIISFEDFQALFRPFKANNHNCAKVKTLAKIVRFSPIIFLLFLIMMLILIDKQTEDYVIITFFLLFFLTAITIISLACYLSCIKKIVLRELHQFTQTIQHQRIKIQLKPKKNDFNIPKWILHSITVQQMQFQVISKNVKADLTTVKLYCKRPAIILQSFCPSINKPIFYQESFQYDKGKLEGIISFAQFQGILRPFSQSEAYKQIIFLLKCLKSLILAPFFTLLPLLILIKNRNYHNFLIGLFVVVLLILCFWLQKKIGNSKTQALLKLKDFCNEVSLSHQKYEITPHIREKENIYWTQTYKVLYCFEIKRK